MVLFSYDREKIAPLFGCRLPPQVYSSLTLFCAIFFLGLVSEGEKHALALSCERVSFSFRCRYYWRPAFWKCCIHAPCPINFHGCRGLWVGTLFARHVHESGERREEIGRADARCDHCDSGSVGNFRHRHVLVHYSHHKSVIV